MTRDAVISVVPAVPGADVNGMASPLHWTDVAVHLPRADGAGSVSRAFQVPAASAAVWATTTCTPSVFVVTLRLVVPPVGFVILNGNVPTPPNVTLRRRSWPVGGGTSRLT